jgi:hypothetical protein
MKLVEHPGFEAAAALIQNMVAGRVDPSDGHVVRL